MASIKTIKLLVAVNGRQCSSGLGWKAMESHSPGWSPTSAAGCVNSASYLTCLASSLERGKTTALTARNCNLKGLKQPPAHGKFQDSPIPSPPVGRDGLKHGVGIGGGGIRPS